MSNDYRCRNNKILYKDNQKTFFDKLNDQKTFSDKSNDIVTDKKLLNETFEEQGYKASQSFILSQQKGISVNGVKNYNCCDNSDNSKEIEKRTFTSSALKGNSEKDIKEGLTELKKPIYLFFENHVAGLRAKIVLGDQNCINDYKTFLNNFYNYKEPISKIFVLSGWVRANLKDGYDKFVSRTQLYDWYKNDVDERNRMSENVFSKEIERVMRSNTIKVARSRVKGQRGYTGVAHFTKKIIKKNIEENNYTHGF